MKVNGVFSLDNSPAKEIRRRPVCQNTLLTELMAGEKSLKLSNASPSERASSRIAALVGELALRRQTRAPRGVHSKALVTITHKSNVLSRTDGLFRESALAVLSKYYSAVAFEEQIVDFMVYKLSRQPYLMT